MRYCFETFVLDTLKQELRRQDVILQTPPQVMNLLTYLIEHRDEVVTKEELVAAVWHGRALSDAALATRLNVLRRTLNDDGRQQRLVKTLPRMGVRFVAEVRREYVDLTPPIPTSSHLPSIAVLPFENASGKQAQDFFGDALADEVLTELARLRFLLVIARNSSFSYRGHAVDVREIGSQLGVGYVLEGSSHLSRGRARVTSRLVDAATGHQIWSSRYDFRVTDVLEVLADITGTVVAEVGAAILEEERRRVSALPLEALTAWQAYQRGITHILKTTVDDVECARKLFTQAIRLDPGYSAGYDGLAWAHLFDASAFKRTSQDQACRLSEPLARKAIELDPRNASARARLALTLHLRGMYDAAIEETNTALASCPNSADACGARGAALVFSGRHCEGRLDLQRFMRLSPRDPARPIRLSQLAAAFYFERDYESAVATAEKAVRSFPNVAMAYRWLAAALGQLGRRSEGSRVIEEMQKRYPTITSTLVKRETHFRLSDHEHFIEGLAKAGWRK